MWTERHSTSIKHRHRSDSPSASKRSIYQRDRARIIHSSSFRSMQSKTQVLGLGESDFYRTRLTHSLEVAQIGSGICEYLKTQSTNNTDQQQWLPSFALIEAICLAHDIGHPPFGHGGEVATNYLMRNDGGFEANGQTLRILTRLGEYSEHDGLDLTRRTLLGTIKYPAFYHEVLNKEIVHSANTSATTNIDGWIPPKCLFKEEEKILEWILRVFSENDRNQFRKIKTRSGKHACSIYKAFDTSIMEFADDIAYGVHDLEDAIALNLLSRHQWTKNITDFLQSIESNPISTDLEFYTDKLFSGSNKSRKHAISKIVGYFINSISIETNTDFEHPLLSLQASMETTALQLLCFLKNLIMQHVILRPELQALQFKGQQIVIKLFSAFADNPRRLLPQQVYTEYLEEGQSLRIICDYIASMTDVSATRLYHKLFSPSAGSMFDRI